MKKISRMVGVAALLLLAAAGPASAARHQPDREVPIKGSVMALVNEQTAPVDCPDWAQWRFSSSGTGQMSHLGRVEMELTQCSAMVSDTSGVSSGTTTFTAANGDELVIAQEATFEVVGAFDGFSVDGTWTVLDGGSGRFSNATGSGSIGAVADIPSDVTVFDLPVGATLWNFRGEIAYDASDRSG